MSGQPRKSTQRTSRPAWAPAWASAASVWFSVSGSFNPASKTSTAIQQVYHTRGRQRSMPEIEPPPTVGGQPNLQIRRHLAVRHVHQQRLRERRHQRPTQRVIDIPRAGVRVRAPPHQFIEQLLAERRLDLVRLEQALLELVELQDRNVP